MAKVIDLDCHATTKVDPKILKVIKPYFNTHYYNPSSVHFGGEMVAQKIEEAREQVASLIKANPDNIFFTNSATESNNIILKGMVEWADTNPNFTTPIILSTNTEHNSIVETISAIDKSRGYNKKEPISYIELKVNKDGKLDYEELENIFDKLHGLCPIVSVIHANNEIGTIHNLDIIGKLCKRYDGFFHTDATQSIGRTDIDVSNQNIFALSCSGHKIYSLKGCGVLYIKDPSKVRPVIDGGRQNILSSGTINVPAVIGMGKACEILEKNAKIENKRMAKLRDLLWNNIHANIPDAFINGTMENRLPHNLSITLPGVPTEAIVRGSNRILVSGGSACQSGNIEPSRVILALGTPYPECSLRIGIGRFTTVSDINNASKEIIRITNYVKNTPILG